MNQPAPRKPMSDPEMQNRLRALKYAPPPNLARGRARVLAAAQRPRNTFSSLSRRTTFALAFGVSVALILVMFVMSSAFGAAQSSALALTRTDTVQAQTLMPVAIPGNELTPGVVEVDTASPVSTPFPGLIPEPPHSPVWTWTRVISPGALN